MNSNHKGYNRYEDEGIQDDRNDMSEEIAFVSASPIQTLLN